MMQTVQYLRQGSYQIAYHSQHGQQWSRQICSWGAIALATTLAVGTVGITPASAHGTASPQTETTIISTVTAQQMDRYLKEMGFLGTEVDKDGDIVLSMQGYKVLVLVNSLKGETLQFSFALRGTNATLDTVNRWNEKKRFAKAYLAKDGLVHLESDLDLTGGVTLTNLKEFVRTFNYSLGAFLQEVGE